MSSESSSHPEEAEPAQEIVTLAGEEVLDEGEESDDYDDLDPEVCLLFRDR